MPTIQDSKNLLVNWLNKNQSGNVQTNINKSGPTNTKDVSVNNILPNQNLKTWTQNKLQQKGIIQPTIQTNNNSKIQAQMDKWKQLNNQQNVNFVANQNNQSRFIGLQNNNNLPSTDLGGNIIQANVDKKKKEEFNRRANKPVLNIPTKKSQIEQFNKNQSETYRTNENVIKDFHYDVQKFGGQMTKEQISQLYPEFAGKEDIALMLQSDLLPLVQNNEFADMKKLSELYPELLPKQKKAGDQILKDQEKEGQQIKDLAKKAEKTLSRYNVLSKNGEKYMQDVWQVGNFVDTIRKDYKLPGNPSDLDIINFGKENIPELKAILDDMEMLKSNYNLTERDRDIIFENGFDLGEWLYQAGADIQNFTQNNKLGDYLDRNSSTWERQLSNLGINGGSANTIANLPKKTLDTAEIPVNMVGELASGLGQVGIATERIATQQNRNEDGTVDTNGVMKDIVMGGGGAMTVGWNTVMAIPTAIYNLANETEAGAVLTDTTIGNADRGLDKLLSGKTLKGIGLDNNAIAEWYNDQDEQTQAEARKILLTAIFHKGSKGVGKLKKLGNFEINSVEKALGDLAKQKITIETNSPSFKAKVEQGLADGLMKVSDDGMLTDAQGNNIGKVKVRKMKTGEKVKYVVDKVIADNRIAWNKGELNADVNMNALPDNRTFREKTESQINQAKETAYEGAYQMGKMTRNAVDTVKEGVQNINVGNAVKGTAEAVGKGVKATSDLYNKGKNAVTQGKNKVTNAVKENVVEPFKKGYEGVKETVNENIVEPYNKGRGKTNEFNKKSFNQGQQLQESNSTSEINNKVNGDNYTQKNTNSKKLNKVQLKLLQNNNRMNPKAIDTFKEWYGEDYGQYMYDRGFTKSADGGNLDDMENYKNSLLSQKRETLNKIEGTYQDISLSDMAEHLVEKATNVRNRKLLKEAQELQNKHNETGLTMPEADRLRTLFQQNVKMGFHQDIPADARERAKNEYMAVKDFLDDVGRKNGFDDLDNINREIQKTQHIIKGIESKLNRESANNAYTLTDYILMAEAFTNPQTAAVFTAKQVLKNPKVRSAGLNVAVGGRGNAKNRVTAGSREKTNENVESIAGAKRKQKEMGLSENPALPESIKLRNVVEIDKRKPTDTTPPTEKIEKTAPKEKSESKPKNKVTSKKSEVTEKKTEVKEEKKAEQPKAKKENKKQTIEERNAEFEKSVDEDKLNEIREYAKENGKLEKVMSIGVRKVLPLKNHEVMLSKAEIDILKNEGLLGEDGQPKEETKTEGKEVAQQSADKVVLGDRKHTRKDISKSDNIKDNIKKGNYILTSGKDESGERSEIYEIRKVKGDKVENKLYSNYKEGKVLPYYEELIYEESIDDFINTVKENNGKIAEFETEGRPKNIVTEKAAVTTKQEPKQEDKSGGNAFGLQKQKGSSRINNFTNVIKKIVDKYSDDIEGDNLFIELGEPYLPLEIDFNADKKELIVRHPNLGYDDPAIRFTVDENGKLKPTGIKQAFMEQMMGVWDWSPIKETDDLLHTRAVNLEDQYLGERNIDEDTGVMKEGKSESAPKEVKDRTSNANIINNIKSFDDLKDLLKPTKAGAVSDWEYEGKLNGVKTRVRNYGDTIFIKYGEGQGPAQARIDIADKDHIDQLKELLSEINNDGEILESNRSNPFSHKEEVKAEEKPETKQEIKAPIEKDEITGQKKSWTKSDSDKLKEIRTLDDLKDEYGLETFHDELPIVNAYSMKQEGGVVKDYYYGRIGDTNVIIGKSHNYERKASPSLPEFKYEIWIDGAIVGGNNGVPPMMTKADKFYEGGDTSAVIDKLGEYLDTLHGIDKQQTTTEVTAKKNAVTAEPKKIDNSSITGKFRNLTLQDYKEMQKYQGVENQLINGDEQGYILGKIKNQLLDEENPLIKGAEIDESELYPVNYDDLKELVDKKKEIQDAERKLMKKNDDNLSQQIEDLRYGYDNEMLPNLGIYGVEDVDTAVNIIESTMSEAHFQFLKDKEGIKPLVEKYGNYWEQGKSVDKKENTNIIGKNNSLTTKNPTNARNDKANSGKANEGQTALSNTVSDLQTNDRGAERPADKGLRNGGESSLMSSNNNISEHGTGPKVGGGTSGVGQSKSIRTKGDNVITEKTTTQARDINRDCVSILEKHEFSDNPADYTAEEIETLRQYEGRGGINDKADSSTQGALNQYYTKDNIIKAMWRLLDGYEHTDILEPSMGVGRFFMYAPEGSNLAGFEYDKIPGTIAKILYPDADIKIGDFQDNFMLGKFSMGDNYTGKKYDIVIGNPPYEERQGRQKALGEEPKITRFDDYFIKRGVDMLKPGGHLAFVTSSQFLRGADNYAKQMISKNAELIDAYRIPVGAFDRTGVETDIIILRKKEGGGDSALLSTSKWFQEHPEKVLGEEREDVQGRFGPKKAVVGDLSAIDEIGKARVGTTDGLPATLKTEFTPQNKVKTEQKPVTAKTIEAKEENKVKVKPKKEFKPNEWKDWTEVKTNKDGTQETVTWGKSLNGVVYKGKGGPTGRMTVGKGGIDKYQNLLNANGKIGDPDIKLEDDREGLNYIAGELEPNLLYASGQIPLKLEQLEKDYEGGFIDEQQYNKQKDLLEQATPQEIDYQNIYFSPYLDWVMEFPTNEITTIRKGGEMVDVKSSVRSLFKKYVGQKIDSYPNIVYKNSNGDDQVANAGRVMLDIIVKGKDYPASAKERVITLLPKEFNKFLKGDTLDSETKTNLQREYNKKYNSYANFDYGELGYTVEDIAENFNGSPFQASDVQARGISRILTTESMIIAHGVGQGKTIEGIIGAIASMQQGKARKALVVVPAGTKASRMQTTAELFPNQEMVDLGSLAKGTGIRNKLVEMYGPDPRDWIQDGQLVFLEHSAIGRQISFKNDTLTELEQNLTDVMESHFEVEKNIEDRKKSLERADKDIERAREKGASASDIEKKQKKREELVGEIQKMGRITENSLQDIMNTYRDKGLPEEGIGKALEFMEGDYDEFLNNMNEYLDNEINVGQAKIDKEKALKVANDIFNNERPIYLEDLGIDHLTVDEAHNFRNLFNKAISDDEDGGSYHAGMQTKEGSKQAKNLYAMSQYIMSKNGGGNVILLTATPFINDPSEMYNMLSYVGKNGMMEMGVTSMDDFYDNFVGLENRLSPTASTSGVGYKNVMVGFNNTETLVKNLLDRYIDYEGESGRVVKPRLITNVSRLKMGEEQTEVENLLEEQIDKNEFKDEWRGVPLGKKRNLNDKGEAKGAVLEGMQQANLNLISPYLTKYLKDKLPSITWQEMIESSPKLKAVIEIIKKQRDMGIMRGTFIYMEQGKELHERLKKAIEESIPGIKVGIINGDKKYSDLSAKEAEKLGIEPEGAKARQTAKKFSDGEIDVLIGGANTKEGINLQGNGYHLIEVSQPRNMNDRTQLNGRMWRQGNLSNEVLDTLLLMENSSDIYRFELMSRKQERWNILEQLSAYKKGQNIEDVKVQGDLDMNEEKLALFTDPEKKARVSITMEKADLEEQKAQTKGQISTMEKLIDLMSNWKNDYGWYRKLGEGTTRMDKLYDENQKAVTTDILDENALEPLQQQLDYAWNEAMKKMEEYNSRRPENGRWTKAEMEKNIRNNSPYSYEAVKWKEIKDKMQQARSERNLVIRQTDSLGIKTVEGLSDFIQELEQQLKGIESKLAGVESTFKEKVEMFRHQQELNKENEMDLDTILKDLEEDFKHQLTLGSKEELRNWIELTKDLPKREQARSKNAVTGGKNKYSWNPKDYVGKKATFDKPKNLITSKYSAYSESNPKPEIKYVGYTPKEIVKKKDGGQLTRIGYQQQFYTMNSTLNKIKRKYEKKEEEKSYWNREEISDILARDSYYQGLKTRLTNMLVKFAKRYDDEIIKAYKKDNPGKTPTGPEDFYDYINDYTVAGDTVLKIEDEYVKQGAEYLFNKYNGAGRNNVTANDKNKITNG